MASNVGAPGLVWEVYVVEYARSKDQPVATLIQSAYDQGTVDLPFAFVLARSGARNVLVDCGSMRKGNGIVVAKKFAIPNWISENDRGNGCRGGGCDRPPRSGVCGR
jgi:hypothetical protein